MKKLFFTCLVSLAVISAVAQDDSRSGVVIYESLVKVEFNIEGNTSNISHMLPKELKSLKELKFNEQATLYRSVRDEDASINAAGDDDVQIHISMDSPDQMLYTDLENGTTVEQKEFMTRKFLISAEAEKLTWKLTGNKKIILDLPCQEATTTIDSSEVKAWFCPSITVSGGPEGYAGLPGLILELDIDNGQQMIVAESIDLFPVRDSDLQKPSKGKKVTGEEYDQIVAEKLKEQGIEGKGGKIMMVEISQD